MAAINGLLCYGESTVMMFAVMSRAIADRVRVQPGMVDAKQ
jgi:hypothetical protein